jgi:hypothetical protein
MWQAMINQSITREPMKSLGQDDTMIYPRGSLAYRQAMSSL